ncbi:Metallophosphoesterase 1 [Camelus dromedarius]|uniref:Metallophosphoesterase 1 n=1 Tax=Camelus dromedarius TaxID=9838 RepID=A0A5N4CHE3_CAMDR|nr:Metallophosphoesterase 1 [Camelus dromedarius]
MDKDPELEWQMERAFQTALWLLQPEVVFILGDVFDEGKWSSSQAWADDVGRFQTMFRHPAHVQLRVVAGNHDVGFHYHFVLVNSVAMEGDGCDICSGAEAELLEISRQLNCSREHFPLYRRSDAHCSGEDAAPPAERGIPFQERYDVLSREASRKGSFTPTDYVLAKCPLPREDTVLTTYCGAAGCLVVLTLVHMRLLASPLHVGWNLLRKFKTT